MERNWDELKKWLDEYCNDLKDSSKNEVGIVLAVLLAVKEKMEKIERGVESDG